jgi:transglutaminase-like putative cysteine protease
VDAHVRDVLRERRGVYQDLTHAMIALCRTLSIPALYVSGYLYGGPKERLRGTHASHAWCEVFVPGLVWRGLDPTNDQPADERYVKVAVGRDYADVAPVLGHYRGTDERRLDVEVLVEQVRS